LFKPWYIPEPELIFSKGERSINPCYGLTKFGPCGPDYTKQSEFISIKMGLIGTAEAITSIKSFIDTLTNVVFPKDKNAIYLLQFPGLNKTTKFNCTIQLSKTWEEIISRDEWNSCKNQGDWRDSGKEFLNYFEKKLELMKVRIPPPNIILLAITNNELKTIQMPGLKYYKVKFAHRTFSKQSQINASFSEGDLDFHNIIKAIGLKHHIPTQLVTQRTWEQKESQTQDPCMIAWNFSVANYYKATGLPWKIVDLSPGTCYAGISFYPESIEKGGIMNVSLAQIFLHTGQSYVLRGEPFHWDSRKGRDPHLNEEQAAGLMVKILEEYKAHMGQYPSRIVLHKTTNYRDDELKGFENAANMVSKKDFLTLFFSDIRFYTDDDYPVVRGTVMTINNEYLLFTSGYIPALGSYSGNRVPVPLHVKFFRSDSPADLLLQEILAFTKLDWNNAEFASSTPITLKVSQNVGRILAEKRTRGIDYLEKEYRFYM